MSRLDHVIFAVRDLDLAAERLFRDYGLEAQPGGVHGDAGTGNLYVPLGEDQYIELLAITNPASTHPMVQALKPVLADGDRLMNFAITSEDIQVEAARLGEPVFDVETHSNDGEHDIAFRLTGVSGIVGRQLLPFFIQTTSGREWRGGARTPNHRVSPRGVGRVEYGGDHESVARRIDDPDFPIDVVVGRPGLAAIWIKTNGADIELRA